MFIQALTERQSTLKLPLITINISGAGRYLQQISLKRANIMDESLRQLSFSTNQNWLIDWNTLELLKVKRIHSTNYSPNMSHMVIAECASTLLSNVPRSDNSLLPESQGQLAATPKVRISLAGRRYFAPSTDQGNNAKLLATVNNNLKHSYQQGLIQKANR